MKISLLLAAAALAAASSAHAAPVIKFTTGTDLSAASAWNGSAGPAPTSTDVATWDIGSAASGLTLGANDAWQGIKVNAGETAAIDISGANTLSLGSAGIDMSSAIVGLTFGVSASGAATNPAGITLTSAQTWDTGSNTLTINGRSAANGGTTLNLGGFTLTKQGTGTLTLSGGPTISNGTLAVTAGALSLSSNNASPLSVTAGLNVSSGATLNTVGNSGGVTLGANSTINGVWNITTGGSTAVNATMGGTGAVNITQGGTLSLGTSGNINGLTLSLGTGTLQINRTSTDVQSAFTAAGTGFQTALTGTANFAKSNVGVFTLDQANTYSGTTTITNGRLIAANAGIAGTSGALGKAGAVSVSGGSSALQIGNATTSSVSNVGSITVTASGKLDVTGGGTNAVTLTMAASKVLTMASGTGLLFANTGSSIILSGGTAALTGIALDLGNQFNVAGTYHLISGGTVTTTGYSVLNFDSVNFSQTFTNGDFVVTAIPEPSTYGLLGAGVLAGVAFVRRRRKVAGRI